MKKYLKILIGPAVVLAIVAILALVWKLFNLPSDEELVPIIKSYFDTYGIIIVFLASVFESAFIVGVYAPGGLVIFLGVIFAIGSPMRAVLVVASVILGFLVGFTIDYYIGKYGWYKVLLHFGLGKTLEKTKERVQKYKLSTLWAGYHHPDFGSFIATSYGILKYPYKKFLLDSILPITCWCALWGTLAYMLGMSVLDLVGYQMLFIILGFWILVRIIETQIEGKRKKKEEFL